MKRLDVALVELGLAPTRSKAQDVIEAGVVEVKTSTGWRAARQASHSVPEPILGSVRVRAEHTILKYVSRGGLKIEGALRHLQVSVAGWRCLDIGISTGGFTDCLLQAGARAIAGVDVGHGQLAEKLKTESKLKLFERVNVRDLAAVSEVCGWLAAGVDLCVVDVSFISLQLVLPVLAEVLPAGARLLALVKPQFEVGPEGLDKHGLVKAAGSFDDVKAQVLRTLEKCGFSGLDYFPAELKGRDGNQEFFAWALRLAADRLPKRD